MDQSFGESAFRSNFEMGAAIFPSVPVRKNVLWVTNTELAGAIPANVHSVISYWILLIPLPDTSQLDHHLP